MLAHKRATIRDQLPRRVLARLIKQVRDIFETRRTEAFVEGLDRAPSFHPNGTVEVNYSGIICPCTYEMYWVRPSMIKEDLSYFTDLSVASDVIASSNELDRNDRQALYREWYTYSPYSFMLLKEICHCRECRAAGDEAVLVVAASIIIPLNRGGATTLAAPGAQAAKSLVAENHFIRDLESHLLLDTLVARRGYGNYFLQGFQWSLFLQHVHEFLTKLTNRAAPITFWVEPDEPGGNYDLVSHALTDTRSATANENCYTYSKEIIPNRANTDLGAAQQFDEAIKLLSWKKIISKIDSMSFTVK